MRDRHHGGDLAHRHAAVVSGADRLVAIFSQFLGLLAELRLPPRVADRKCLQRSVSLR
jgi:hypothetical protein